MRSQFRLLSLLILLVLQNYGDSSWFNPLFALSLQRTKFTFRNFQDLPEQQINFANSSKKLIIHVIKDNNRVLLENHEGNFLKSASNYTKLDFHPMSGVEAVALLNSSHSNKYYSDGIFGFYHLPYGLYALHAVESAPVISFFTNRNLSIPFYMSNVRIVTKFQLIPLCTRPLLERLQLYQKQVYSENLLLSTVYRHSFYFTHGNDYDLLRTLQANHLQSKPSEIASTSHFSWNENVTSALSPHPAFYTTFINAYIDHQVLTFANESYVLTLISRRSKNRQGPRYIKRGGDESGNVANFVETEQIIYKKDDLTTFSSYVQIRGSLPFMWKQIQPWKMKPPMILNDEDTAINNLVMQKHFQQLLLLYLFNLFSLPSNGKESIANSKAPGIVCVNLIDRKGSQGKLGVAWLDYLYYLSGLKRNDLPRKSFTRLPLLRRDEITTKTFPILLLSCQFWIRMIWFDFHHQMEQSTQPLFSLYEKLKESFAQNRGFFSSSSNASIISIQKDIIRTNCIDCLDRTNVIQTTISRWALYQQIALLGGNFNCPASSLTLPDKESEDRFRELWTRNGDVLSLLYAGSNAMKRDVTRLGKRTHRGRVDDAISFARRYVSNNLQDYEYQNGIDLLLTDTISYHHYETNQRSSSQTRDNQLRKLGSDQTPKLKAEINLFPFQSQKVKGGQIRLKYQQNNDTIQESLLLGLSTIVAWLLLL